MARGGRYGRSPRRHSQDRQSAGSHMSMMQITNEDGVVCEVPVPQLERGSTDGFLRLLSHKNIKTVERNHPDEFIGIMRDVEALKARTGLPFSSDESRRLTALSILVSKS